MNLMIVSNRVFINHWIYMVFFHPIFYRRLTFIFLLIYRRWLYPSHLKFHRLWRFSWLVFLHALINHFLLFSFWLYSHSKKLGFLQPSFSMIFNIRFNSLKKLHWPIKRSIFLPAPFCLFIWMRVCLRWQSCLPVFHLIWCRNLFSLPWGHLVASFALESFHASCYFLGDFSRINS